GERGAHGKARSVRSCAARASEPPGANGTMTGWVSPARVNSAMRSRQKASGPTTPRPSRNRADTCFTAPARSPERQAAFTASTSSTKPALRKRPAYGPTVAYPVMSRASASRAAGASSVTHVRTNDAISNPASVRPAVRAPASRCLMEAGAPRADNPPAPDPRQRPARRPGARLQVFDGGRDGLGRNPVQDHAVGDLARELQHLGSQGGQDDADRLSRRRGGAAEGPHTG